MPKAYSLDLRDRVARFVEASSYQPDNERNRHAKMRGSGMPCDANGGLCDGFGLKQRAF